MRNLPLSEDDRARMLAVIGAKSIDELFRDVPESARLDGLLDLPLHMGDGWIFKVRLSDASQLDDLMDEATYNAHVAEID